MRLVRFKVTSLRLAAYAAPRPCDERHWRAASPAVVVAGGETAYVFLASPIRVCALVGVCCLIHVASI
jgi:hypothetical protein